MSHASLWHPIHVLTLLSLVIKYVLNLVLDYIPIILMKNIKSRCWSCKTKTDLYKEANIITKVSPFSIDELSLISKKDNYYFINSTYHWTSRIVIKAKESKFIRLINASYSKNNTSSKNGRISPLRQILPDIKRL